MSFIKNLFKTAIKLCLCALISFIIIAGGVLVYYVNFSDDAKRENVRQIYKKLTAVTGVGAHPMLIISDKTTINASTNGIFIDIHQGMVDNFNSQEIALVLGHELAHVYLNHVGGSASSDKIESQYDEAMADKLGAFYMMRAGYDVCEGREAWKRIRLKYGNDIDSTHPNYSFRYDELNVGCE